MVHIPSRCVDGELVGRNCIDRAELAASLDARIEP
jgi:hypothetical protein